ncbi:MAG: LysR family transcriptional regulator [Lachnospiraceae bacterium]|nr:LysR family transcriptional regulator [Lachnospiraceae bacterium]
MTTRQLYYLVTISDQGSLSQAAKILGISQPALSKFLTDYEDSLGFLIFLRHRRQLTPTAVGRYVIESAQKILDEQTRLLQTLRAVTDTNRTRIRLATAPNRGAIIYSRIYNPFSHRYPDIALTLSEIYASDQPGAILHGQIDIAIGSGKTSEKVTDLPIAYEELLVSLPVSHPMAQADRIRLSDLRDTPFVLQGPRHSIRILAEELFQEAGFHPVVAFESSDVILVDSMLHQAVGAGLVSQAHVFPCEELVYRPLDPPIHQTLHIRYPLGHTLTEPERYLAGLLIRERLSDPRYQAIPSEETAALIRMADGETELKPESELKSDSGLPSEPDLKSNSGSVMPLSASGADRSVSGHNIAPSASSRSTAHPASVRSTHRPSQPAPELNLNTQQLQYIIAIVDEKSLTRAAEKYYLTQPALSRHLHNVESMLCTQLFTRVHNRLQPTNGGKIFVNFARNMLKIESELSEYIHAYRIGHGGGIHLQCDACLAEILRTQIKPAFTSLHPNVNLSITESSREDTQEALLNASTDFGLYFSCQEEHPILDCRILAESELVYCFGEDFTENIFPKLTKNDSHKRMENAFSKLTAAGFQLSSRPMALAAAGSDLRAEQNRLLSESAEGSARIVCEAQVDILQLLSQKGAADTILPIEFLSPQVRSRCVSFPQIQNYYLLLAQHPGRNLPPPVKDLVRLLNDVFETYFEQRE